MSAANGPSSPATHDRFPARFEILDAKLIEAKRDLIESHYRDRRVDPSITGLLDSISELNKERIEYISQGNTARNKRKTLSSKIGSLMKDEKKSITDITILKDEVDSATRFGEDCADRVKDLDTRIGAMLRSLPNLLDDR